VHELKIRGMRSHAGSAQRKTLRGFDLPAAGRHRPRAKRVEEQAPAKQNPTLSVTLTSPFGRPTVPKTADAGAITPCRS